MNRGQPTSSEGGLVANEKYVVVDFRLRTIITFSWSHWSAAAAAATAKRHLPATTSTAIFSYYYCCYWAPPLRVIYSARSTGFSRSLTTTVRPPRHCVIRSRTCVRHAAVPSAKDDTISYQTRTRKQTFAYPHAHGAAAAARKSRFRTIVGEIIIVVCYYHHRRHCPGFRHRDFAPAFSLDVGTR